MNFQKLISKVMERVEETTTSADISYMPGSGTTIKRSIENLLKFKPNWKIEVLEDGNNYNVSFEDKLKIIVPKIYYKEFNEKIIKVDGVKEINLKQILTEAEVGFDYNSLIKKLHDTLNNISEINDEILLMNSWLLNFKNSKVFSLTNKTLLNLATYDLSIVKLLKKIEKKYGKDRGYLERAINYLQEKKFLGNLDIFNQYDYLAGVAIESVYLGETIQLRLGVNLSFHSDQSIQVKNEKIAQEMDYFKDIKTLKNIIYPVGGKFKPYVFSVLKETIKENSEK